MATLANPWHTLKVFLTKLALKTHPLTIGLSSAPFLFLQFSPSRHTSTAQDGDFLLAVTLQQSLSRIQEGSLVYKEYPWRRKRFSCKNMLRTLFTPCCFSTCFYWLVSHLLFSDYRMFKETAQGGSSLSSSCCHLTDLQGEDARCLGGSGFSAPGATYGSALQHSKALHFHLN